MVALRIELSADSDISRVWATSPRLPTSIRSTFRVGMAGFEPTRSCSQDTWACRYPTSRYFSLRSSSSLSRKSQGLPSDPCGIRTRPVQLERLMTSPEVERANLVQCAASPRAVGRERSNPPLRLFRPPLYRLSYRPALPFLSPSIAIVGQRKKARCPCDTEPLGAFRPSVRPSVTSAEGGQGDSRQRGISLGGISCRCAFLDETRSYEQHGSHVCCKIR